MGFVFEAIQRSTGVAPETPSALPPEEGAGEQAAEQMAAIEREELRLVASPAPSSPAKPAKKAQRAGKRSFRINGSIPTLVASITPPLTDSKLMAQEQCRVLRTHLLEAMRAHPLRTLLVTSAMAAEGKTTIAANLAYILSQLDSMKILLVDADLRRPGLAKFLGLRPEQGLDTFLQSQSEAELEAVTWELTQNLDLVPCSAGTAQSSELLHGERMEEFLRAAASAYELVILDSPPLFPIADAQALAPLVDAALLVVRAESGPAELAKQAAELLRSKLIGTVLNASLAASRDYSYKDYLRYSKHA